MVTSQVLNGVHCERYLTNCFSFQLACGLTLGGKIAGKFTKAHPQKSRGKQTCTDNSNKILSLAGQSAVEPTLLVLVIFSKETSNGARVFFL